LFENISSESALRIKEKIESLGACVKIQESKKSTGKKKKIDGLWEKNKRFIEVGAIILSSVVIFFLVFWFGFRKYVPGIYKSEGELKLLKKSHKYGETSLLEFKPRGKQKVSLTYSIIGKDIVDSETEAGVQLKIGVDRDVSEKEASALLKELGDEERKRGGFKYFKNPQKVDIFLYKEEDRNKFGEDGWSYKYSWEKNSLEKIIAQNIKKINSYPYTSFKWRRFAYYLDEKFILKTGVSPEIKLFPSEYKDGGVQVGIFEKDLKINKKNYLSMVAGNVGSVLKEMGVKCEGIFVELPTGKYFIPPELCKLSNTKWGENFNNSEFVKFVWRNVQKDEER